LHKRRKLTRENRERNQLITGAIVGYTNAGKSTLMNALCESDLHTMDQVFATLDPTARRIKDSDIPILLIDTVGFIRKLPHQLVEAFQSTLEEVSYADFIVEVTDISDPEFESQMDTACSPNVAFWRDSDGRIAQYEYRTSGQLVVLFWQLLNPALSQYPHKVSGWRGCVVRRCLYRGNDSHKIQLFGRCRPKEND